MKTLLEYLSAKGIDANAVIVEYRGEVYAPGADLSAVPYREGEEVGLFRVVAGG